MRGIASFSGTPLQREKGTKWTAAPKELLFKLTHIFGEGFISVTVVI